MNEPIDPEIVLFGLILVNFFPLNVLPNINPPMSEFMQINKEYITKISEPFFSNIELKIKYEKKERYNNEIDLKMCLNALFLTLFLENILYIKPLNSIQEIIEIIIKDIIKTYK